MEDKAFDSFFAIIDKATKESITDKLKEAFEKDTLYKTPYSVHLSTITKSFVDGVIDAQPWEATTKLPEKLDSVTNWVLYMLQREYKEPVATITISNAVLKTKEWAMDHPEFQKWTDTINTDCIFYNMAKNMMEHVDFIEKEKKRGYKKDGRKD